MVGRSKLCTLFIPTAAVVRAIYAVLPMATIVEAELVTVGSIEGLVGHLKIEIADLILITNSSATQSHHACCLIPLRFICNHCSVCKILIIIHSRNTLQKGLRQLNAPLLC
jgi:hypothetical protein